MKIVGLTGGIGSGKSTIAKAFKKFEIPVYIADDASKQILNENETAVRQVIALLGENAYQQDSKGIKRANRGYIASQVFADGKKLKQLNNILHPLVRKDFERWLALQDAAYIIYEAAILFESGGDEMCDAVILVTANWEDRIARVVKRDQVNEAEVRERLKHQSNDLYKLGKSDYVIVNEDLQLIDVFVNNINEIMLKTSK